MRQLNKSILTDDGINRALAIQYPDSIAFMYSRQPVIVRFTLNAAGVTGVSVTVTGAAGSHTETRALHSSKAEFDISRQLQLLSADVDTATRSLDYGLSPSLSPLATISVAFTTTDGASYYAMQDEALTLMYGALDQGEIYGEPVQRRLWLNFPQTFNLWEDTSGNATVKIDGASIYPDYEPGRPNHEIDFMGMLEANNKTQLIEFLENGGTLHNVELSWRKRIEDGAETDQTFRAVTLVPDCRTRKDGAYLRWINRRGEMSYWLFTNSKSRVTSVVHDSFTRYYGGDPAAPDRLGYLNPQKATYREAREMVLGATGLSFDEFEELCSLAVSTVVERLMPNTDSIKWQRVNVVAGTFERDIRRVTPSLQDLEILIELPERNTIQL